MMTNKPGYLNLEISRNAVILGNNPVTQLHHWSSRQIKMIKILNNWFIVMFFSYFWTFDRMTEGRIHVKLSEDKLIPK